MTRPETQGRYTATLLREQGHRPWLSPVLAIQPKPLTPEHRTRLMNLDNYQHLFFVSQNAATLGLQAIDEFWPQLPSAQAYWAIGQTTAAILSEASFLAGAPGAAMNSEALLALDELQELANNKVLIFKGEGGRTFLAEQLTARGAQVEEIHLYTRGTDARAKDSLQQSTFGNEESDLTLAFSGESAERIAQLVRAAGRDVIFQRALVVPGQRVARLALALGFKRIVTAENATDRSMLQALSELNPQ